MSESTAAEAKPFGIGAILTVTTGALMCDLGELYGLLGHLTGESLMTHQLPRASRESEGFLRDLFPDLADIEAPDWSAIPGWDQMGTDEKRAKITNWLDGLDLGSTRDVPPLPAEDHTRIDPIAELKMMRPDEAIIAVNIDSDDA